MRNPHVQTLVASQLRSVRLAHVVQHRIPLPDGDQLVAHESRPQGWQAGGLVALLYHGVAGCHRSPYLTRLASKLTRRGVRVVRFDHRGCGAGVGLARRPYHAGRTDDIAATVSWSANLAPDSPLVAVGFSLSGNILLNWLGSGDVAAKRLTAAAVVCPPADLPQCSRALALPLNRWYDRYFTRLLLRHVRRNQGIDGDYGRIDLRNPPKTLFEFDDQYTAYVSGYDNAVNYYATCSSVQHLGAIQTPTLLLIARDDPLAPPATIESAPRSSAVRLYATNTGGHLGFLARKASDPDWHWMDWRIIDWIETGDWRENRETQIPEHESLLKLLTPQTQNDLTSTI